MGSAWRGHKVAGRAVPMELWRAVVFRPMRRDGFGARCHRGLFQEQAKHGQSSGTCLLRQYPRGRADIFRGMGAIGIGNVEAG